jgi:beta-glucosidase
VSDYQDIEKLTFFHHVAATYEQGIEMALEAGIDMSMVPLDYSFPSILEKLVLAGKIRESVVNNAAGRILQLKENVGLFAQPFANPNDSRIASIGGAADRQASLEIARQSITVLKNNSTYTHHVQSCQCRATSSDCCLSNESGNRQ